MILTRRSCLKMFKASLGPAKNDVSGDKIDFKIQRQNDF